ncbi:MAG: Transcription initiation factor IIB [Candidatus Methanolliviera sp. GoM_asphalt]|nr:MAG: Transcription initiation factor IIB [Candidatus Methanolliviera sp. GoM_asphalt]
MRETEKVREIPVEIEETRERIRKKGEIEKEERLEEIVVECPRCGSRKLIQDYKRAELVCEDCGFVLDDNIIDPGPEWRAFDHDQRMGRSRTGPPATYTIHDKGLSTMIDWTDKDSYGKTISSTDKAQLYRLRKWQRRIRVNDATERNLAFALSELDRMASALSLPRDVREASALVYRRAVEKNLIRGRSIEGVATAALYAGCRECSVPRTLNEIAAVARVNRKEIGRTYRFIARELKLNFLPISPTAYISRFCSALKLSEAVEAKALETIQRAKEKELTSGKGPTGVAAAAIYIASIVCGEKRTQREVADVVGVTEVTIRNRYKEIASEFGLDISP